MIKHEKVEKKKLTRGCHISKFLSKINKIVNLIKKTTNLLSTCDVNNTLNVLLIFHTRKINFTYDKNTLSIHLQLFFNYN